MATLALNPFSASATTPGTATTTTLTGPASVVTGHPVTFTATVSPSKTPAPVIRATGTVTFTITGADSSNVDCTGTGGDVVDLTTKGKAACKVASGSLLASASPYSVTAVYSGDTNFGTSTSSTLSQPVTAVPTHITITYDAKPTSDSATTFTATVTGGSGSLPTGTVTFEAIATNGNNKKTKCNPGGDDQALSPSSDATPVAQATCSLAAGWLKVATANKSNPKPTTTWALRVSYLGDANHSSSSATKRGTVKS